MKITAHHWGRVLLEAACIIFLATAPTVSADPSAAVDPVAEERSPEAERFAIESVIAVAREAGLDVAAIDVFEAFRGDGRGSGWLVDLEHASQRAGLAMVDVSGWSPRDIASLRRPTLLLAREHQGEEARLQPVRIDFKGAGVDPPLISSAAMKPESMEWARILPLLFNRAVVLVPPGEAAAVSPRSRERLRLGWGIAGVVCGLCVAVGLLVFNRSSRVRGRGRSWTAVRGPLLVAAPAVVAAVVGVAASSGEDSRFTPDPARPYELRAEEVREEEEPP